MKFEFCQLTSAGDRDNNQDFMGHVLQKNFGLFVVADGLGGHSDGEKASRFFCEGFLKYTDRYIPRIAEQPIRMFSEWLDDAIDEMQRLFAGDLAARKAHTTCAILYIDKDRIITAHCGDSRIYRLNPQQIVWRTRDHSVPQQLLEAGLLTEQDMALHPEQNQLTRTINALSRHEAEIREYPPMQADETFVICTDGFWESVKQEEFLQLAQLTSTKQDLKKLARLTVLRAHGKSDNVTVQWLRLAR